ncbi:MAG: S1/P1 nuclease [Bacteriovoracaceae bacterium]|nr:S1/P1 nuclease [Bacteriovoracaceae bacterium]
MTKYFLMLTMLLSSTQVFAWGDLGHQAVAEVAQQNLTKKTQKAIEGILGIAPLASAAIFPDIVRSDARFNGFSPYHFVEVYPFYRRVPSELRLKGKNATTVLELYPQIFLDHRNDRNARMIALSYFIHVVGDIHQPLHVGNGIDLGANLCLVKWNLTGETEDTQLSNLHTVWDEKIIDYLKESQRKKSTAKRFFGYAELAKYASDNQKAANYEEAKAVHYTSWMNDTVQMRNHLVYPDAAGQNKADVDFLRPYCGVAKHIAKYAQAGDRQALLDNYGYEGDINLLVNKLKTEIKDSDIPVLTNAYADQSLAIIKNQIYIAGLRLAHLLNTYFDRPEKYVLKQAQFRKGFKLEDLQIDL